ncbi:MAG: hypothetical protein WBH31_12065 [Promethearchaeia archaeon]
MKNKNKKKKKQKKIDSDVYGEEFVIENDEIQEEPEFEKKEKETDNDLKEEDIDEIYR